MRDTKHIDPENYPDEFKMISQYFDALIEVKDMKSEETQMKLEIVSPIIKYFNSTLGQKSAVPKFTRDRFLNHFLAQPLNQDIDTRNRLRAALDLSSQFLTIVDTLKNNVFDEDGLPSLLIKDEIRKTRLDLRFF